MTSRVFGLFTTLLLILGLGASATSARGDEPFRVKDINSGTDGSLPIELTAVKGRLLFSADDGTNRRELWMSDGTAGGTVMVKDINPVPGTDSDCCVPHAGVGCDDSICEAAVCEQATECCGGENWEEHCADLASMVCGTVCARGSSPDQLTDVNGVLFFTADDSVGSNNKELWISDGTHAGTVMVKDINVTGSGSDCCAAHATPGCDDPSSCEVFVCFAFPFCCSDGSVWDDVCASFAAQVCPICELGSAANVLTNVNGTLFFRADDGVNGLELWTSDGTQGGTEMVKDINPGEVGQSPIGSTSNINGRLFFSAFGGSASGRELWSSDGTAAGTVMVKDISSGFLSSSPEQLTDVNGTLFFRAHDGTNVGIELWKSDGTAAGTVMVKDIHPQFSASVMPRELTNVNGTLFFSANDGIHGIELWRSDGTEAGTVMVKDINPGAGHTAFAELTNVNGIVFFRASPVGVNNAEIWKSDGTEAGTLMVRDINPVGSSFPRSLLNVSGTLLFAANNGADGEELWMSDGTAAGTVMVADINPGPVSSKPDLLTNVNGTLFFRADDGAVGSELWALQVGSPTIPTVSDWGLIMMLLLLMTAASIVMDRPDAHGRGPQESGVPEGGQG